MQGFELLKQHRGDKNIFDTWLKDFESTLDGKRKLRRSDSMDDYKKFGVHIPSDSHLVEYCVSGCIQKKGVMFLILVLCRYQISV
jgi:hypothetical protein